MTIIILWFLKSPFILLFYDLSFETVYEVQNEELAWASGQGPAEVNLWLIQKSRVFHSHIKEEKMKSCGIALSFKKKSIFLMDPHFYHEKKLLRHESHSEMKAPLSKQNRIWRIWRTSKSATTGERRREEEGRSLVGTGAPAQPSLPRVFPAFPGRSAWQRPECPARGLGAPPCVRLGSHRHKGFSRDEL